MCYTLGFRGRDVDGWFVCHWTPKKRHITVNDFLWREPLHLHLSESAIIFCNHETTCWISGASTSAETRGSVLWMPTAWPKRCSVWWLAVAQCAVRSCSAWHESLWSYGVWDIMRCCPLKRPLRHLEGVSEFNLLNKWMTSVGRHAKPYHVIWIKMMSGYAKHFHFYYLLQLLVRPSRQDLELFCVVVFILWQCTKASRAFGWVVEAEESVVSQRGQGLIEVQWFDQGQDDRLEESEIRVGRFCSDTPGKPTFLSLVEIGSGRI